MRLLRLAIDGFGMFQDRRLPDQGEFIPGLVVLSGPNESGKSTLLAFLRRVLYGYPDARSRENPYPPLAGGRHGGRVLLSDEAGKRIWIERFSGSKGGPVRIYEDGGVELPAATLSSLLAHIPREVYHGVFAFALSELTRLGTLDTEGVRDRIYGAGLGTAVSPAKVAQELAKWQAEILKPRGKARVNDSAAVLRDRRSQLRTVGDGQAAYERLCSDLADAEKEGSRLAGAVEEKRQALLRRERLMEARPHFVELRSAQTELGTPGEQPFPEAGVERYNRTKDKIGDVRHDLDEANQELEGTEGKLAGVRVDEALIQWSEVIDRLHRGLEKFEGAQEDLPKRKAALTEAEQGLQDSLRDLGLEWTEGRLSNFDLSIPFREEIRQWRGQKEETRIRLRDAQTKEQEADEAVRAAEQARDVAKEEVRALSEPATREDIAERRQAVRQLRAGAQDLRLAEQQAASFDERLRDKEEERESLAEAPVGIAALPKWPAWIFALAGLLGAGLATVFRWGSVWTTLCAVSGLLLAITYRALCRWLSGLQQRAVESRERRLASVGRVIAELSDAKAKGAIAKAHIEAKLQEPLARLGLPGVPSPIEIERLDAEIDEECRKSDQWERAQAELIKVGKELEQAEQRLREAVEAREQAAAADEFRKRGWKEWLQAASLAVSLSPDGALEFLSKAESARSDLRRIADLRHRIEGLRGIIGEYLKEVSAVLEASGRAEEAGARAVDRLASDLAGAREAVANRRSLQERLEGLRGRCTTLTKRLREAEGERDGLFAAAMVEDEEGFFSAASATARRAEAEGKCQQAHKLLETSLGSGAALQEALQELEDTPPEVLAVQADHLRDEATELQKQAQEANHRVGELRQAIRGLETDDKASRLRAEIKSLEEDMLDDGERWAVLTIARAILRRTQDRYERERRPMVVEEAEKFFGEITDNRYQLVSPAGETRLELESTDGRRKALDELSRGTCEQLYLSLRFGYICELARQGQVLPVIMDDVLVNFDPDRARGAAKGIARLADSHQVLLFTCHPETVALLEEVAPQVQLCCLPVT